VTAAIYSRVNHRASSCESTQRNLLLAEYRLSRFPLLQAMLSFLLKCWRKSKVSTDKECELFYFMQSGVYCG